MSDFDDIDIDSMSEEELGEFYEIQLILTNEFGEFKGVKVQLPRFHCDNIIKMSKTFYANGGFELTCEDGSHVIFAPEIVQRSILRINKRLSEDVQE